MNKLNGVLIKKFIVALHFVMNIKNMGGYKVNAEMRLMARKIKQARFLATTARFCPFGSPFS
jgi:hypothetical protein